MKKVFSLLTLFGCLGIGSLIMGASPVAVTNWPNALGTATPLPPTPGAGTPTWTPVNTPTPAFGFEQSVTVIGDITNFYSGVVTFGHNVNHIDSLLIFSVTHPFTISSTPTFSFRKSMDGTQANTNSNNLSTTSFYNLSSGNSLGWQDVMNSAATTGGSSNVFNGHYLSYSLLNATPTQSPTPGTPVTLILHASYP